MHTISKLFFLLLLLQVNHYFSFRTSSLANSRKCIISMTSLDRLGITTDNDYVKFELPSEEDMALLDKQFGNFIKGLSPIFLSHDNNGRIVRGIRNVPLGNNDRPVLFVGNHQLYGADLSILIKEFIEEREVCLRGLAHPMVFSENFNNGQNNNRLSNQNEMKENTSTNLFQKFGAVEVGPESIFNLLRDKQTVLLYPGGVREAYHDKENKYELFWPKNVDFVRMAGLFNAVIVPFAGIGIADSVEMILNPDELKKIPFVEQRLKKTERENSDTNKKPRSARPGDIEESLIPPLSIPKLPSRNYFLFGEPIDTANLNIYDKKATRNCYEKVRNEVKQSIWSLQKFRRADPFEKFEARLPYELIMKKQAPTAPLNILSMKK